MFGQPELMVMCGLSGSGKTSCAELEAEEWGYEIVSSDNIRAELGDVNDQSQNNKVFQIFYQRIKDHLNACHHVIADATFLTIKERRRILEEVKDIKCYKSCYIMATPFDECLKNNKSRDRQVPESVIYRQRAKFQVPFEEEGWDDIDIKYYKSRMDVLDVLLRRMTRFDQKNPHHQNSLLVHSVKVAEKFAKDEYDFWNALLHDYGKLFTQTFDENEVAHYYNHESVGAYELLINYAALTYDMYQSALFLTNYHMLPFGWKTDKAKEKWRRIFGDEKFQMLMDFHECDKGD